jgi:hypothetical protein
MRQYVGHIREKRKTHTCGLATALVFLVLSSLLMGMSALAADDQVQRGGQGSYGEKQKITTSGEALKVLKKHFASKDVIIGEVVEKELYFEADIMDRKKTVIDKVVVDKRTGRVRSIY